LVQVAVDFIDKEKLLMNSLLLLLILWSHH